MEYIQSTSFDKERLLEVLNIDSEVYDTNFQGTYESVSKRYKANEEMFIFAIDDGKLAGYICFFPISDNLCKKIKNDNTLYDDNIEDKDICKYRHGVKNNIYIISVVTKKEYRNAGIGFSLVKNMFDKLSSLNDSGYDIDTIYATSVSNGGKKLLNHFNFQVVKEYEVGKHLLSYSFISYNKMDLYLMIPLDTTNFDKSLYKSNSTFLDMLNRTSKAEISSLVANRIERYELGKLHIIVKDDYENESNISIITANAYISTYRAVGTLIIEIPNISIDPTFVLDENSRESLIVKDGEEEILLKEYLSKRNIKTFSYSTYLLVSGEKLNSYYRSFVLASEAFFNRIGSKIVSKEICEKSQNNIAQYEFADIYISGKVISFEINEQTDSYEERIKISMLIIYIHELLSLKMAAIMNVGHKITKEFDSSPQPSTDVLETILDDYGKNIILFNFQYKYYLAKVLSDNIQELFSINEMFNNYQMEMKELSQIITMRADKINKKFSKKQDNLFKVVSVFTLLISINNVINLFAGLDFSKTSNIVVFTISSILWLGAVIYLFVLAMKHHIFKKRSKDNK